MRSHLRTGIDRTIKILHAYGYADPNDGRNPIPTEQPNQWIAVLTKILLIEISLIYTRGRIPAAFDKTRLQAEEPDPWGQN
ncbi:MAG: hypothetical protein DCF32_15635 [Leptolyngbya sp.]|nr:MAG: hypothetical protein DCF32_15635 [Leptolyngbya sp.]